MNALVIAALLVLQVAEPPEPSDPADPAAPEPGAGTGAPAEAEASSAKDHPVEQEAEHDVAQPVVVRIDIVGSAYFRRETFLNFIETQEGEAVDAAVVMEDAERVTREHHSRGFLTATVTAKIDDVAGGVVVRFVVNTGERAELKEVHVVGNVHVDEASLREGFFSRPPEPLGALTRAGLYHRPYLDQDQQRLVFNYYRRGFLEARVSETRVTASSDLSGLQVTLSVVEGPQYELIDLAISGELYDGADVKALRDRITIKNGDVADLVTIQQQADPLLDPWREQGYPFVRFEQALATGMSPSGDDEKRGIAIGLKMVKGPLATVRDVRIVGNKGTMPHVFLRELEPMTGEVYDHVKVKRSEKNLLQTGLLQAATARAVAVNPKAVDGGADTAEVDVEVTVTETTTWLLSPAFFGDANEGLIFIGVAGDRNLLGTGLQAFASVQSSPLRFLFDVSLTEPRLLGTRSSATAEVHRRELRYRDFTIASVFGGSLRANYAHELGFRMGGPARVFVGGGLGVEYGGVVPLEDKPVAVSALLPRDTFRNTLEARVGYDSREGGLSPRNGLFVSADAATAGPWTLSGLTFIEGNINVRGFYTPLWGITLKSNTQLGGLVNPLGEQTPVTDRYFLGGLGTVRGFFPRSIGPIQDVDVEGAGISPAEVGGVVKFVQNVEIEAPLWPDAPLRGFVFCDVGNAFGEAELGNIFGGAVERDTDFLVLNLMTSIGFGLLLETPVLPFRFEWSVPITRRDFDQPIVFFLGIGSAF